MRFEWGPARNAAHMFVGVGLVMCSCPHSRAAPTLVPVQFLATPDGMNICFSHRSHWSPPLISAGVHSLDRDPLHIPIDSYLLQGIIDPAHGSLTHCELSYLPTLIRVDRLC